MHGIGITLKVSWRCHDFHVMNQWRLWRHLHLHIMIHRHLPVNSVVVAADNVMDRCVVRLTLHRKQGSRGSALGTAEAFIKECVLG